MNNKPYAMHEMCYGEIEEFITNKTAYSLQERYLEVYNNNKALIEISGTLAAGESFYNPLTGRRITGYSDILRMVKSAEEDLTIDEISLAINSGGGEVVGCAEVVEVIRNCSKPVRAYVTFCCSAAYWIASQCDEIITEENSTIGNIGALQVIVDRTKQHEELGLKVEIIKSGDLKGANIAGTAISEEQRTSIKKSIDLIANNFKKSVASGRGNKLNRSIDQLATGESWHASEALSLGIIDRIDNALYKSANSQKGNNTMTQEELDQAVAEAKKTGVAEGLELGEGQGKAKAVESLKEMTSAFPDDTQFALEQFTSGASLIEAKAAYADVLAERNKELVTKLEQVAQAEMLNGGTDPVPASKPQAVTSDLKSVVEDILSENKSISRKDAVKLAMAQIAGKE